MNYEERLIRYIASKLIQRKYLRAKGEFPNEEILARLINKVLKTLKEEYKQLKYVRIKSEDGLVLPAVEAVVKKIKL